MKVERVKLFKSFFLRRMAVRKIEGWIKQGRSMNFLLCRAFFRLMFFPSCLHVVFRISGLLWMGSCGVSSVRVRFDAWGSHPGCRIAKERRRAEPKSGKSENRGMIWRREEQNVLLTKRWQGHPGAAVFGIYAISNIDLERPWVFCSGASCIMLAVSTLR